MAAKRIVITEMGADFADFVQTEPGVELVPVRQPANDAQEWRGYGPERGLYEDRAAEPSYLPPQSRAA